MAGTVTGDLRTDSRNSVGEARSHLCGIALVLTILLLGCARPERATTIKFWGLGWEGEVVSALLPQFEKETGIRVSVQQIPWTAAHEKILTGHVGNSLPDVFQTGNTWIPELVTVGAILPLDGKSLPVDDYFPGIWETNKVDGTLYGVPWYVDTRVLFYRTDMVATPPRSWSELITTMERLKRETKTQHFFPLLMPTNEWPQPVIFALQRGATLVSHDGHARFREPAFLEAFSFYTDIFRRGLAPAISSAQVTNIYQQFGAGEIAMFISGPWDVGNLRQRLSAEQQKNWSTAPLPSPDGTPYPGLSLSGGSSLVISRRSTKQDAAWKFIEFLSRPDVQIRFHEISGDLPARRSAWNTPALTDDPQIASFRIQLDRTGALPRVPEIENIVTTIFEHGQLAARGQLSAAEAAARLDRRVETMLEKRRWVLERRRLEQEAAGVVGGGQP
jgi:multiple sugar transport system substrate-binding protein